ncbi:hypothetical protein [Streptomyces sp. NPDC057302]|uniref:hypothetical protein n=1 Tax=Streptomyces sp. NPDC057302 TaxID=3346094 RepID=UPI00363EE521
MNTDDLPAQRAADSQRQAAALALLEQHAAQNPVLAQILGDIDTLHMEQRLTASGLRAESATAQRDAMFDAAYAETERRVRAACGPRRCSCGHTVSRHSLEFTEDARIPCTMSGCRCGDLTLDQRSPR